MDPVIFSERIVTLEYKEAAIAGRLARLVQQAADQEEEPREVEDESMRAKALMDHIFASAVGIMWSYVLMIKLSKATKMPAKMPRHA